MTFLWPSFSSSLELVQVCIKASFTKLPAREIIPAPKSSYRTSSGWFPSFYICLAVYFLSHLFPVSAFPLVVFSVSVGFLFHYRVVFMLQNRAACLEIFQLVEFSICVCLYMRVSVSHRLRENVFMNHSGFGPIAWIGTSFVSSSNQKIQLWLRVSFMRNGWAAKSLHSHLLKKENAPKTHTLCSIQAPRGIFHIDIVPL